MTKGIIEKTKKEVKKVETKLIRVKTSTHQRLCERGMKTDSFNSIIERLLDLADEYDEIQELIQADKDLKEHNHITEFNSLQDFKNYFEV